MGMVECLQPDYYETLGVARSAMRDDIATAYRELVKKYHPDHNPNDDQAVEKFKLCTEAHEILSDPEKRSKYDMGYGWL